MITLVNFNLRHYRDKMNRTINNYDQIGDQLIDPIAVKECRVVFLHKSYDTYKNANVLLGYFSQLAGYTAQYNNLLSKIVQYKQDICTRYKDLLIEEEYQHIFKDLLVSSNHSNWYTEGADKFSKVKNYTIYFYRRKLYILLEDDIINIDDLKKIIDTITSLDRNYDIYDHTLAYFMKTSNRFDTIMKKHFREYICF